jgi:hypothetical protein
MAELKVTTEKHAGPSSEQLKDCGEWDTAKDVKYWDTPTGVGYHDEKCPEPTKKVAK